MSKPKLQLPKNFSFQTNIPVRITDVNYGGHVGNDSVLTLLHEARMQFLNHHSFSEMEFSGVSLIMTDVTIEFKKEIFYGDTLEIFVTVSDFSNIGFDVYYKIVKNKEETVVAVARTGMVCYDYTQKKIARVPETISARFANH
jgi:YbgC/YbaW family acyl-CoA thioester hydrolase